MVFQEPMTSLNPVLTVGEQMMEGLIAHRNLSRKEAKEQAIRLLALVGIPAPAEQLHYFPHQMSGGMRQRVMIATAMSCQPSLLIADEPTTALDVTIQAQILCLMKNLQQQLGTAILLITHDLGVVAGMADHVLVMYLGRVVESAKVETLFRRPLHPYTAGLLCSMPSLQHKQTRLHQIAGTVPNPADAPTGCAFDPRCPQADAKCRAARPPLVGQIDGHLVACWHPLGATLEEVSS